MFRSTLAFSDWCPFSGIPENASFMKKVAAMLIFQDVLYEIVHVKNVHGLELHEL